VRSTAANPPRRGSSKHSIRCKHSARPAKPSSPASGTKVGHACPRRMMTAGSPARRRIVYCFGHPAVQHDDLDGAPDAEHSVVLCAVRARGHRRAYPRQDRRFEKEGDVDGRGAAAGYRVRDWRLVIVDGEAEIVRTIFRRYAELGSVPVVEGGGRGPRDQKQVVDERFGSPHPASGSGRFYSVLSPPFGNRAQLSQHRNGPTKPVLTGRHGVADDAMPCRRPRSRASNRCKRAPIAG